MGAGAAPPSTLPSKDPTTRVPLPPEVWLLADDLDRRRRKCSVDESVEGRAVGGIAASGVSVKGRPGSLLASSSDGGAVKGSSGPRPAGTNGPFSEVDLLDVDRMEATLLGRNGEKTLLAPVVVDGWGEPGTVGLWEKSCGSELHPVSFVFVGCA